LRRPEGTRWPWLARTLLLLCMAAPVPLAAAERPAGQDVTASWALLAGYGFTHTNLGETRQWVETVDLVGRYDFGSSAELGRSWYQGRHSLLVELPLHFVVDPAASPMVGVNFLLSYRLTGLGAIEPYGFMGGGPLYSGTRMDGMGSHWNGNWQWGLGLRLPQAKGHDVLVEYRYHHISNGGRRDPNDPLNSSKVLVGIRF